MLTEAEHALVTSAFEYGYACGTKGKDLEAAKEQLLWVIGKKDLAQVIT